MLVCISIAQASTIYVNKSGSDVTGDGSAGNPFATIQFAINSATSGDTVNVASGTYQEDIVINKSLTLQGAGKTETTILRNASVDQVVLIQSSDVTITDFKIDGVDTYFCDNIISLSTDGSPPYENITITDSHLLHSNKSSVRLEGKAVAPEDGTLIGRGYKVNDNIIEYFGCGDTVDGCSEDSGGIAFFKALDVEIKRNIIRNSTSDTGYTAYGTTGIYFMDYTGGTIADNNISRVYGGIMINSNVEEIYITNNILSESIHGISETESFFQIHITGNIISTKSDPIGGLSYYQNGINLGGDGDTYDSCPPYEHEVGNLQHEVSGNTILGDNTANSRGIRVKAGMIDGDWGASGVITGNTITNYATGLAVWGKGSSGGDRTNYTFILFNENSIINSTTYASTTSWTGANESIDATYNWWGTSNVSLLQSKISAQFDFTPYYLDACFEISAGDSITSSVILDSSCVYDLSTGGISITSSDVTFDCDNAIILCDETEYGASCIEMFSLNNVTIKNCDFRLNTTNLKRVINGDGITSSFILDNKFEVVAGNSGNTEDYTDMIWLVNSNITFQGNIINNSIAKDIIYLTGSNSVMNNNFIDSMFGFIIYSEDLNNFEFSNNIIIQDNFLTVGNSGLIAISNSDNIIISSNDIYSEFNIEAVKLKNSKNSLIEYCNITGKFSVSVKIAESQYVDINNNYFMMDNANAIKVEKSYDILLDSNHISQTIKGIEVEDSARININNNEISGINEIGIKARANISDINIINNTLIGNFVYEKSGIEFDGLFLPDNNIIVSQNTISNVSMGIKVNKIDGAMINGNHIFDFSKEGIIIDDMTNHINITNNIVENPITFNTNNIRGISLSRVVGNILIDGNTVDMKQLGYPQHTNDGSKSIFALQAYSDNAGDMKNITISNNKFYNAGNHSSDYISAYPDNWHQIIAIEGFDNLIFENNDIINSTGYVVFGKTNNAIIRNNIFERILQVSLTDTGNYEVFDNIIRDGSYAGGYGISCKNGAVCNVTHNNISGHSLSLASENGGNTYFTNNIITDMENPYKTSVSYDLNIHDRFLNVNSGISSVAYNEVYAKSPLYGVNDFISVTGGIVTIQNNILKAWNCTNPFMKYGATLINYDLCANYNISDTTELQYLKDGDSIDVGVIKNLNLKFSPSTASYGSVLYRLFINNGSGVQMVEGLASPEYIYPLAGTGTISMQVQAYTATESSYLYDYDIFVTNNYNPPAQDIFVNQEVYYAVNTTENQTITNTDAGVSLNLSGSTGTGIVALAGYTQEPETVQIPHDAVAYTDVYVSSGITGIVTVDMSYLDGNIIPPLDENELALYAWYDNAWNLGANQHLDMVANIASADFPAYMLTGSPLMLGGLGMEDVFYTASDLPNVFTDVLGSLATSVKDNIGLIILAGVVILLSGFWFRAQMRA